MKRAAFLLVLALAGCASAPTSAELASHLDDTAAPERTVTMRELAGEDVESFRVACPDNRLILTSSSGEESIPVDQNQIWFCDAALVDAVPGDAPLNFRREGRWVLQ